MCPYYHSAGQYVWYVRTRFQPSTHSFTSRLGGQPRFHPYRWGSWQAALYCANASAVASASAIANAIANVI
eukprot:4946004-Lingulodinium_polyedra.AAC.1